MKASKKPFLSGNSAQDNIQDNKECWRSGFGKILYPVLISNQTMRIKSWFQLAAKWAFLSRIIRDWYFMDKTRFCALWCDVHLWCAPLYYYDVTKFTSLNLQDALWRLGSSEEDLQVFHKIKRQIKRKEDRSSSDPSSVRFWEIFILCGFKA